MSLGLVAYGSSDESGNEDDSQETHDITIKDKFNFVSTVDLNEKTNVSVSKKNREQSQKIINSDYHIVNKLLNSESEKNLCSHVSESAGAVNILNYKNNGDNFSEPKCTESRTLSSLPAPKAKLHDIDFDWSRLSSKSLKGGTQPVKISIPSLAELEAEDSSEPVKKKIKPSQKGSGLFALLPSPKNSSSNLTKTRLKPQQIQNKIQNKPQIKNINNKVSINSKDDLNSKNKVFSVNYDDSPDEDEINEENKKIDFFSLSSSVDVAGSEFQAPDLEFLSSLDKKENKVKIITEPQNKLPILNKANDLINTASNEQPASSNEFGPSFVGPSASYIPIDQEDLQLDETALQQLCGRRERQKGSAGVQLIDVNGDAILPDAREWLTKQLTEEQNTNIQSHKKKDGPTTQQRRKHQITYLAFQAKEHELELKNQWANNRMSRKQTQAKYGF